MGAEESGVTKNISECLLLGCLCRIPVSKDSDGACGGNSLLRTCRCVREPTKASTTARVLCGCVSHGMRVRHHTGMKRAERQERPESKERAACEPVYGRDSDEEQTGLALSRSLAGVLNSLPRARVCTLVSGNM